MMAAAAVSLHRLRQDRETAQAPPLPDDIAAMLA